MTDFMKDITDFHTRFSLDYSGPPRELSEELIKFRLTFMAEELCEYVDMPQQMKKSIQQYITREYKPGDLERKLDALVDLVYVALGTAYLHGFDFNEAWRRVHAANMTKIRCERAGDSARSSTYDVIKPSGFVPPDLSDLVVDTSTSADV